MPHRLDKWNLEDRSGNRNDLLDNRPDGLTDCLADLLEAFEDLLDEEARGVGVGERVVVGVGVAVEALGTVGRLDKGVGGEEASEGGVVDPAVHVDQPDAVEMLVAGEAARGFPVEGVRRTRLPVGQAPLSVRVVGQVRDHGAGLVGDGLDRAQVVLVQVTGLVGQGQAVVDAAAGSGRRAEGSAVRR